MKLLIYGYGFVGKAHYEALKFTHDVVINDPALGYTNSVNNVDAVIVCVSTPQRPDGACEMENVFNVVEQCPDNIPILIKSTISVEGWELLVDAFPKKQLTFIPEFLRAKTAVEDFLNSKYFIVGNDTNKFWGEFFKNRFPNAEMYYCTAQEAIATKCAENSFLALKVSFFNQLYDYCEAVDIDFEAVRNLLTKDWRVNSDHSFVTEERGWGGHCFPKDTAAWIHSAQRHNVELTLIKEARRYNKQVRKVND